MQKECGLSKKERMLDAWRGMYCIIIPSIVAGVNVCFLMLVYLRKLDWEYFWSSDNFCDALGIFVTFISITLSFFGILIPILVSGKSTSETIKFFFEAVDKKYFLGRIKAMMISGFISVFLLGLLFFYDIFHELTNIVLISAMIWFLLYFVTSSYRLISLLLLMFLTEKKKGYKGETEK